MRVTSDLWVSALVRRIFAAGGFAAVERRGATEAGAIFLVSRSRFGDLTLYGPAPQASYGEAKPEDRFFLEIARSQDSGEISSRLAKEARFDPDLWIVEVELDDGRLADMIALRTP